MRSEFRVSCSENSEKSSEKVVGGWVDSEGYRGVQRYPVWYISSIEQAQKRGQDNVWSLRNVVTDLMLAQSQMKVLLSTVRSVTATQRMGIIRLPSSPACSPGMA